MKRKAARQAARKGAPPAPAPAPPAEVLALFLRLLAGRGLDQPPGFYARLWTPLLTLWYLLWRRLAPGRTLAVAAADARRGGADGLCGRARPLSKGLRYKATTAYSDARQRLPLAWVRDCFFQLAGRLAALGQAPGADLPVELLDGSTLRLRPHGDIPKDFPPHKTQRQKSYWCVARVLVSFCARTGLAMAARLASLHESEQALAVQLMLERARRGLYVGDRNFGVWRVVRAAAQGGGHALVRLTAVRARRLWGKKRLPSFLDQAVVWTPTAHDQVDPGLRKEAVAGRLIVIQARRRGHRPQTLFLFTTLTDAQAYSAQRLLELYGWRWQAELNFRTVKDTLELDQLEAKSADMARKEFYAGLMAYNLVRGLMAAAAAHAGRRAQELSFAQVRQVLALALADLFVSWTTAAGRTQRLKWLFTEASAARLPRRRRPRPPEPRAQYYEPRSFPKMKTTRPEARRALLGVMHKS